MATPLPYALFLQEFLDDRGHNLPLTAEARVNFVLGWGVTVSRKVSQQSCGEVVCIDGYATGVQIAQQPPIELGIPSLGVPERPEC